VTENQARLLLNEIRIRNDIRPGDLGAVIQLHGKIYYEEFNYGTGFEAYVAGGISEFHNNYDPLKDRIWVCEKGNDICGFLLLMHRDNNAAQLRYFILDKSVRGIGLGNKLMELYMDFLRQAGYKSSYLWTTDELYAAAHLYTKHGFTLSEEKAASSFFGKKITEQRYDLIF
jgi:GNAT superfamily N-acetyltransferase